jgi:hypothetical protein
MVVVVAVVEMVVMVVRGERGGQWLTVLLEASAATVSAHVLV